MRGSFRPVPDFICLPKAPSLPGGSVQGFHPFGELFHSGSVGAPRQLDSPSHSLAVPPGVFCHYRGLGAPLFVSHSILVDRKPFHFTFFPPRGSLLLLLRLCPQRWRPRWHPRWRPCQPMRPLVRLLRRFRPIPLPLPPVSFLTSPPPHSQPPPPPPTSPSPLHSTRRFLLHSPPSHYRPRGTSPLHRCLSCSPTGLLLFISSRLPPSQ